MNTELNELRIELAEAEKHLEAMEREVSYAKINLGSAQAEAYFIKEEIAKEEQLMREAKK